jgi:hypothetical protein
MSDGSFFNSLNLIIDWTKNAPFLTLNGPFVGSLNHFLSQISKKVGPRPEDQQLNENLTLGESAFDPSLHVKWDLCKQVWKKKEINIHEAFHNRQFIKDKLIYPKVS